MDDVTTNLKSQSKQSDLVRRIVALIEAFDGEGTPTLAYLGAEIGVSPYHLQRVFKKEMGVSPRQYAEQWRLENLKGQLRRGQSVTSSLYEAGYGGPSRLYESANQKMGMTPASYGKGGKGAHIHFAIGPCALGFVLVAITKAGLCRVCFGDDEAQVEDELTEEFPAAHLERADQDMKELLSTIVALVNTGQGEMPDLALDVRVTAFQAKVWSYLIEIPSGKTLTYVQIAAGINMPGAARAVGRACGSNPVGVVIPCHRAIGADGKITGYRWGIDRKKALLDAERART